MKNYFDILTPYGLIRYKNIENEIILTRIINEVEMPLEESVKSTLLKSYSKLQSGFSLELKTSKKLEEKTKVKLSKSDLENYKNLLLDLKQIKRTKIVIDETSSDLNLNFKKSQIIIPNINNYYDEEKTKYYKNIVSQNECRPFLNELILVNLLDLSSLKIINHKNSILGLNENNENNCLNDGFRNLLLNTIYPSQILCNDPKTLSYQTVSQLCQISNFDLLKEEYLFGNNLNKVKESLIKLSKKNNCNELLQLIEKTNIMCHENALYNISEPLVKDYIYDLYRVQNITVKYLMSKIKTLIDNEKTYEEINELISSYESVLLTPEKLSRFYFDNLVPHDDTVDNKLCNIKKEVSYYKKRIRS